MIRKVSVAVEAVEYDGLIQITPADRSVEAE